MESDENNEPLARIAIILRAKETWGNTGDALREEVQLAVDLARSHLREGAEMADVVALVAQDYRQVYPEADESFVRRAIVMREHFSDLK